MLLFPGQPTEAGDDPDDTQPKSYIDIASDVIHLAMSVDITRRVDACSDNTKVEGASLKAEIVDTVAAIAKSVLLS